MALTLDSLQRVVQSSVCAICRIMIEHQKFNGEGNSYNSHFTTKPGHPFHRLFYSVELNHWIMFESHSLHIQSDKK